MIRFPIDCPSDCPHLRWWDMSVDDLTYVCEELNIQIDGCDTANKWFLPTCPKERRTDEIDSAIEITAWMPLPEPYKGGSE